MLWVPPAAAACQLVAGIRYPEVPQLWGPRQAAVPAVGPYPYIYNIQKVPVQHQGAQRLQEQKGPSITATARLLIMCLTEEALQAPCWRVPLGATASGGPLTAEAGALQSSGVAAELGRPLMVGSSKRISLHPPVQPYISEGGK